MKFEKEIWSKERGVQIDKHAEVSVDTLKGKIFLALVVIITVALFGTVGYILFSGTELHIGMFAVLVLGFVFAIFAVAGVGLIWGRKKEDLSTDDSDLETTTVYIEESVSSEVIDEVTSTDSWPSL